MFKKKATHYINLYMHNGRLKTTGDVYDSLETAEFESAKFGRLMTFIKTLEIKLEQKEILDVLNNKG